MAKWAELTLKHKVASSYLLADIFSVFLIGNCTFWKVNLLKKGNVVVYRYVLYRNPNHWTDLDEILHRGGPWGQESSRGGFNPVPPTPPVGDA